MSEEIREEMETEEIMETEGVNDFVKWGIRAAVVGGAGFAVYKIAPKIKAKIEGLHKPSFAKR